MTKAEQLQRNAQIAEMVREKVQTGADWTRSEIELAQTYAGDGGMGTDTRGTLYEYYTPREIAGRMMQLAYDHGFTGGNVLEPSVGIGRFLEFIDPSNCYVDAYEMSKDNDISYQICQATYPWANVHKDYFESIFYSGKTRVGHAAEYDLVIGNPPYGDFGGPYSGKKGEKASTVKVPLFRGSTYDQYFIWAGIELLKPGGLLIYIIPSSFLDNDKKYELFKDEIYSKADLINAYRMPFELFEFTGIGTDIVVFKKREA